MDKTSRTCNVCGAQVRADLSYCPKCNSAVPRENKGPTTFIFYAFFILIILGIVAFAAGGVTLSAPFFLFALFSLLLYFVWVKKKAKYKVEEGVKAGAKAAKEAAKKIIPMHGGLLWLGLRGIGIGLFTALIGYFAVFAYNGYILGTLGGIGLIFTIIAGLVLLFLFFKFLSSKKLAPTTTEGWLLLILIIILVIAAIYGLYYMNKIGLFTKGAIQFEKVNLVDRIKMTFSSIQEKLTSYIYSFGTWTAPETIEKGKPVGVEFESFAARRAYFRIGKDEISTIALVKVYGLPDRDISVSFDCNLEGEKAKKVSVSGSENKAITIPMKQESGIYQVMCFFDPLYKPESFKAGDVLVKRVDLTAKYENFATISRLKVYTMDEEKLKNIESGGENPFKFYGIKDPLVTEERKTIPMQDTNTPVELWLDLPLMQPLIASNEFYTLGFKLKHNKVKWKGQVDEIKEIRFEFPKEFNTIELTGVRKGVHAQNELVFPSELLKSTSEQLNSGKLSSDAGYIDFYVSPEAIQTELNYYFVKAMAVYDYSFKDSTTVEMVEEKGF